MPAVTGLTVVTDRTEYSRFEADRSVIRARILCDPATAIDDTLTVSLLKGDRVVATLDPIVIGNEDLPKGVQVSIDLNAYKDADLFPLVTRGDYTVKVANSTDVVGESADVSVVVMTVEELRSTYCFGLPLLATTVLAPKKQPTRATGVTITEISPSHRAGVFQLAYVAAVAEDNTDPQNPIPATPATLRWNGGATVSLDGTVATEIIPGLDGNYIVVRIDPWSLSDTDTTEGIVLDQQRMTDAQIRTEIDRAMDEVENAILKTPVEPLRIATAPYFNSPEQGEYFDREVPPLAYFHGDWNVRTKGFHVNLPVSHVHQVSLLTGWMGNAPCLDIRQGSYGVNTKAGILDILPNDSQFSYIWQFFANFQLWGVRDTVANFWRFKAVAGLKEVPGDVMKMIGFVASVPVLTVAAQAYRAGIQSESISKDGVSHSRSYPSGPGGVYGATIGEYKEWIKTHRTRIAKMVRGFEMVTL